MPNARFTPKDNVSKEQEEQELTRAQESVRRNDPLFHIVLFHPEIPQNTGSIGRTCVGIGAKLWLVRPLGFHITDGHLKRAGLDYWSKLDWEVVENWQELKRRLAETIALNASAVSNNPADWAILNNQVVPRFWYFSKKSNQCYSSVQYQRGDVFVFGPESVGLPEDFLAENLETSLRIPISSSIRSLNVSVAVGVAVFEAQRQLLTENICLTDEFLT